MKIQTGCSDNTSQKGRIYAFTAKTISMPLRSSSTLDQEKLLAS